MTYQLKIKLKELAAESQANKLECRKMNKEARIVTLKQYENAKRRANEYSAKYPIDATHNYRYMKLFQRELELQRKLVRWQPSAERSAKLRRDAADCRQHRIDIVKPHARATQIAYGYLKGKSYYEMEGLAIRPREGIMWDQVARMVYKYGSVEARAMFPEWLAYIGLEVQITPMPGKPGQNLYKVTEKRQQAKAA